MTDVAPSSVEPRRLHPATLVARWLKIVPQLAAGGVAIAASAAGRGLQNFLIFAGIGMIAAAAFALLYWWRFTYAIGAREIVIEKGLLNRQRRVIPFDRVQDVAIEQRLLARLFGTAKVKIETGGSAADEGSLDMIGIGDAHALRDLVRRGGASAAQGPEAVTPPEAEPVLFELPLPQLLLSGLFNFSLVFIAAIAGFLEYLDQLRLVDWDDWLTAERAGRAADLVSIRSVLAASLVVILLGMIAGVARTVARDFGYRLTRTETGLRRRRGLFTLSEVVIPLQRTQVAVIESGWIARRFGWHKLSFQTLGADRKEGGLQVAAPFARMDALLPILAEAGFPPPPPRADFHGVPRRALVARTAPYLLTGLAAALAALLFEPLIGLGAGAMLLLALLVTFRWRKHAYRLGGSALFVSNGLFRRRTWIIPYRKTQAIFLARGPIQRPLRLSSVLLDTAGGQIIGSPEIVDLDAAEAARVADSLLRLFGEARAVIAMKPSLATGAA